MYKSDNCGRICGGGGGGLDIFFFFFFFLKEKTFSSLYGTRMCMTACGLGIIFFVTFSTL